MHAAAASLEFALDHSLLDLASPEHRRDERREELQRNERAPDDRQPVHPPVCAGRPVEQRQPTDDDGEERQVAKEVKPLTHTATDATQVGVLVPAPFAPARPLADADAAPRTADIDSLKLVVFARQFRSAFAIAYCRCSGRGRAERCGKRSGGPVLAEGLIFFLRNGERARLILIHSDLIEDNFGLFLVLVASSVFALVVGIAFHEFCHAAAATALGDRLPSRQGRVTLNPLAHLDPAGTVLMLLVGFGWGKPVQFNPFGLRVSPKTAMLLVSVAGPLSNFVAAGLLALPIKLGWVPYINPLGAIPRFLVNGNGTSEDYAGLFLTGAVYLNCILGVFNLIPIHPLDGFKVAAGLLPDDLSEQFTRLAQYGPGILLVILFAIPFMTGYSPLGDIMGPSVRWLVRYFTGVA